MEQRRLNVTVRPGCALGLSGVAPRICSLPSLDLLPALWRGERYPLPAPCRRTLNFLQSTSKIARPTQKVSPMALGPETEDVLLPKTGETNASVDVPFSTVHPTSSHPETRTADLIQ